MKHYLRSRLTNKITNYGWRRDLRIGSRSRCMMPNFWFCAVSYRKIYGPYFLEEMVNQPNYLEMLKTYFWPKHNRVIDSKNITSNRIRLDHTQLIRFKSTWRISLMLNFLRRQGRPPRSPNLNPCDYFLRSYLKSKVYCQLPKT